MVPWALMSRVSARARELFPDPDAPTTPSVEPSLSENDISSRHGTEEDFLRRDCEE